MTKWVCSVCGYVYEGEKAPEACPVCKAPADKFVKQDSELSWAAEHVVGCLLYTSLSLFKVNITRKSRTVHAKHIKRYGIKI